MESLDLIKKLKLKRFIFYTSWRGHTFVGHIGGGWIKTGCRWRERQDLRHMPLLRSVEQSALGFLG